MPFVYYVVLTSPTLDQYLWVNVPRGQSGTYEKLQGILCDRGGRCGLRTTWVQMPKRCRRPPERRTVYTFSVLAISLTHFTRPDMRIWISHFFWCYCRQSLKEPPASSCPMILRVSGSRTGRRGSLSTRFRQHSFSPLSSIGKSSCQNSTYLGTG